VTSLSNFGAFVDIGVGQDGLVHVSELSHQFVKEPGEVVHVGQKVRVKVIGVDPVKRRISLSVKALLPAPERPVAPEGERPRFGGRSERAPGEGVPAGAASDGRGGPGRFRGPARPEGAGAGPGGPRGRGPGGDRGPSGPRGPGGFVPERPGTAPRRAGHGGRFGGPRKDGGLKPGGDGEVDLSRDSGTGSFGSLTGGRGGPGGGGGRGGRGGDRGGDRGGRGDRGGDRGGDREPAPRREDAPRDLDPFQQQLAALRAKLGIPEPPQQKRREPRPERERGPAPEPSPAREPEPRVEPQPQARAEPEAPPVTVPVGAETSSSPAATQAAPGGTPAAE